MPACSCPGRLQNILRFSVPALKRSVSVSPEFTSI